MIVDKYISFEDSLLKFALGDIISLIPSFGNNFDLALWLYDMALQRANSIGDIDEVNRIKGKMERTKKREQ